MAVGPTTQVSDVIVPEVFTPYVQQLTQVKSNLIQSGAVVRDPLLDALLAGGGLTFEMPSYKDLDDDPDNISSDEAADRYVNGQTTDSTPMKIGTAQETAVRLSRNQSWSSADLVSSLIGNDPMDAIANRVSKYWTNKLQQIFVATMRGIFADNIAAPTGTEHTAGDMINDVSGAGYDAGVTDFSAGAYLDTTVTMGDSMEDLGMIFVHSIVYNRMQKNNLIDFIPDARGETMIATFQGSRVVKDDSMPNSAGIFQSWIFAPGSVRLGLASPKVPTEVNRDPDAGNGGGAEILHNRMELCLHPVGHAYLGNSPKGGPGNTAAANNLANADSWQRVYTERKQIPMACLITRER